MRRTLTLFLLAASSNTFAQAPPIALEWSALRPFGEGAAFITRDPVLDDFVWVVYDPALPGDHMIFPFLSDGTDLAPSFPSALSVGSLDWVVDVARVNGTLHSLIGHQNIGGSPQDIYWHLDVEQVINNSPSDGYLNDIGYDLLVTDDAVYGCGQVDTEWMAPLASLGQVIKMDLQGNVLWNVTWDGAPAMPQAGFSSVAVMGDTVFCAAFPYLVLFNNTTGALIDAYDMFQTVPVVTGSARLLTHGTRLYWVMRQADLLHYGQFDFAMGQGQIGVENVPGQVYPANIAIDQYDNCWLTTNDATGGRWYRFDSDLNSLGSGTLYNSIYHMVFVNGKISITGKLDAVSATSYVITGTPQP